MGTPMAKQTWKASITRSMSRATCFTAALVASVVATSATHVAASETVPPDKVALTNAYIIPVVGREIRGGTVLIERGKITAIGTDVTIPFDATEIDLEGKYVMPGMVNPHSWRGLDIPNENLPVAPFLDVYDAIDPSRSFFEDQLREGVTTVHIIPANNTVIGGLSRALRPIGLTPGEMTIKPKVAMKMSVTPRSGYDRMQQMATFRNTFSDLEYYLGQLAEQKYEESLKEKDEKIAVGPAEAKELGKDLIEDADYDDKHANLVRLLRGDFAAWIYCGAAMDVGPAVRLIEEHGFSDPVLVLGSQSHLAARELRAARLPVVIPANMFYRERDDMTGELSETFIPSVIEEAGLLFALQPNPGGSMAEQFLNYQAAVCVRNGISRKKALEAITINPAKMLGLDDQIGSIEVGKTANLVVFTDDPLDFYSMVDFVYIDGIMAYDRSRDHRLKQLMDLQSRQDAAAAEAAAAEASETESDESDSDADADSANTGAAASESESAGDDGEGG